MRGDVDVHRPDALVLGGTAFSVRLTGRPIYRHLASLSCTAFPGLDKLVGLEKRLGWSGYSIHWRPDVEPPAIANAY